MAGWAFIYIYIYLPAVLPEGERKVVLSKPERHQNCVFFFLTHSFSCYLFFSFKNVTAFQYTATVTTTSRGKIVTLWKYFIMTYFAHTKTNREQAILFSQVILTFQTWKVSELLPPTSVVLCFAVHGCSSEHMSLRLSKFCLVVLVLLQRLSFKTFLYKHGESERRICACTHACV